MAPTPPEHRPMPGAITRGFDRIDDFVAVQGMAPPLDAVLNLQAAVGIDEDERRVIRERIEALGCAESGGPILLGLLVGLLAAER